MSEMKKIPYGLTDLKRIIEQNYFYVDKTRFLPKIEETGSYLFLIRPRRFGKSLWLATLELYYDLYYKDISKKILKETYIGQNPTKERSQYFMLKFNFSAVNPEIEKVELSFEEHCNEQYVEFIDKYNSLLPDNFEADLKQRQTAYSKLEFIYTKIKSSGYKLYIIIDEYDNFANTILSGSNGKERYKRLTQGEGFFRHFFNKLKVGTSGIDAPITRTFITGVSPVTMDDVTSGYNIGDNITTNPQLNEIIGFTNNELDTLLEHYKQAGVLKNSIAEIKNTITEWYNHYCFSEENSNTLYNSDMVLFYINQYIKRQKQPKNLIDNNAKTDYKKLQHLITLDRQLNGNFSVLKQIYEKQEISALIAESFPVEQLLDKDCFVSLLYYFGLLSIEGIKEGRTNLIIPNNTIKSFWKDYIIEAYQKTNTFRIDIFDYSRLIHEMAYRGEWKQVFDFLAEEIKKQSKIRDYINGEAMIKGFLMAYLSITEHYVLVSEKELNKGFADLYLEPFIYRFTDMPYCYLIEVKYVPRSEKEIAKDSKKIETLVKEAETQLNQYENDEVVLKTKHHTKVRKLVLVYHGWELIYKEEV